jgi:hypothetical protein
MVFLGKFEAHHETRQSYVWVRIAGFTDELKDMAQSINLSSDRNRWLPICAARKRTNVLAYLDGADVSLNAITSILIEVII